MAESGVEEDELNSVNGLPRGWETRFMTDGRIYYIEYVQVIFMARHFILVCVC